MGSLFSSPQRPVGQRAVRVAEMVRRSVSTWLLRGDFQSESLRNKSFTISEVAVGPDLKQATLYVTLLGGHGDMKAMIDALNSEAGEIRRFVGADLKLRYTPKLVFVQDTGFDHAHRISSLLEKEH